MKPIIRVSVGHDGAHFAADWDLEKIEVQEILNDGEDIYGPTLQFKERSFRHKSYLGWFTAELSGHGHELNGHRCPCPRQGHGRGMDTKCLEKRGVDMDMDMNEYV